MITTNNHRAAQSIVDMANAFVEATTAVSSTEVLLTLLLSEIRKLRLFGRSRSQNEVRWRLWIRHLWSFFPPWFSPNVAEGNCARSLLRTSVACH